MKTIFTKKEKDILRHIGWFYFNKRKEEKAMKDAINSYFEYKRLMKLYSKGEHV